VAKYIPLSLIVFTIVVPSILAGRPRGERSLRTLWTWTILFVIVWGLLCLYVYPEYVLIE
jgi:hypothetical protein